MAYLTPLRQRVNTAIVQDPRGLILPRRIKAEAMTLSGSASDNWITTPDTQLKSFTGPFEIRCKITPVSWAIQQTPIAKYQSAGGASWALLMLGNGTLDMIVSGDGTTHSIDQASTAAVPFVAGDTGWLRVTIELDAVTFYTSWDGVEWTILGTPKAITWDGVVADTTTVVGCGGYNANGVSNLFIGDIHIAEVIEKIDSSPSTVIYMNALAWTGGDTFESHLGDPEGNTWTIGAGARPSPLPVVAMGLAGTGRLVSADSPRFTPTGDMDISAKIAPDDWTPAARNTIAARYSADTGNSWLFALEIAGNLVIQTHNTGARSVVSTVPVTWTDGAPLWVRATIDVDQDAANFYTSTDGELWVQLGDADLPPAVASWQGQQQTTGPLEVGAADDGDLWQFSGAIHRVIWRESINGTPVSDMNPGEYEAAQSWTRGPLDAYLDLRAATAHVTHPNEDPKPDTAVDIRARVTLEDWSAGTQQAFYTSWLKSTSNREIRFLVGNVGEPVADISSDGIDSAGGGGVGLGWADGSTHWVRVVWTAASGIFKFWQSDDGINWDDWGFSTVPAALPNIFNDPTGPLFAWGAHPQDDLDPANGLFWWGEVRSEEDGPILLTLDPANLEPFWTPENGAVVGYDEEVWNLDNAYPVTG